MERHCSRTLSEVRLLRAATMYRDVVFNHLIEHVIEGCGCLYRTSGIFAEDPGFTIQCGKEGCVCGWDTKQLSFDNTACKLHCGDEDIDVSNHPFGVEDQNKKMFHVPTRFECSETKIPRKAPERNHPKDVFRARLRVLRGYLPGGPQAGRVRTLPF